MRDQKITNETSNYICQVMCVVGRNKVGEEVSKVQEWGGATIYTGESEKPSKKRGSR